MKYIFILLIFAIFSCVKLKAQQINFPYKESFRGQTLPANWIRPNSNTNRANPTLNGLSLTTASPTNQFGGVVLDGLQFESNNGLTISFEFSISGGTIFDGLNGDGLSFFLFDASATSSLGGSGRGLGYAPSNDQNNRDGIAGGYLGIGIDIFGNFKANYRDVFVNSVGVNNSNFIIANRSNHVTVRGAMAVNNRRSGYPVLFTQNVSRAGGGQNVRALLNTSTGVYNYSNLGLPNNTTLSLRSSKLSVSPGDEDYRRATITLKPRNGGGFVIDVDITEGTRTVRVVSQLQYPNSVTYSRDVSSAEIPLDHNEQEEFPETVPFVFEPFNISVPQRFKLGFAASTGAATQNHIIRDIEISLPNMPITLEDFGDLCLQLPQRTFVINPFQNDKFYRGSLIGNPQEGNSAEFIDFASAEFSTIDDQRLGRTAVQPNVGTWSLDPSNGNVLFTPSNGFVGVASIYYTAKGVVNNGGPFDQEIYRSAPQKISITVKQCGSVVNPNIPSSSLKK